MGIGEMAEKVSEDIAVGGFVPELLGSAAKWLEITDEQWREYVFPNGQTVRVEAPAKLNIKRKENGDSHRVISEDGTSWYIPAGWLAIHWQVKAGRNPYIF